MTHAVTQQQLPPQQGGKFYAQKLTPPLTVLFMLRLWQAPLGPASHEWRGEIKNLATEESRHFRTWAEIASLVPDMLEDAGDEWPHEEI